MSKGSPRYRRNRPGANLRVESLEDRHLLAAGLGIETPVNYDNDPFSPTAFPLEELLDRTATRAYVPGELAVAFTFTDSNVRQQTLQGNFWTDQLPGTQIDTWTLGMDFERDNGVNVVIVDLKFSANVDVAALMKDLDGNSSIVWSSPSFYYDSPEDPRELIPNDPRFVDQYHHQAGAMNNVAAWDITTGDPSVIIAVTDDGVDLAHVDLAANIWTNTGEVAGDGIDNDANGYIDDVQGWDFIEQNNDPNPNNAADAHGTHVAGITAARIDNGTGVAGTAGGSTIMPVQFFDSTQTGLWTGPTIRESFEYAVDNGAQIVTTSYNINGWVGDPNFTAGIQYIHDQGALHFNSAGNGSELNPVRQAFEQTLLVASTENGDGLSSSSNFGTGIDIAAPGGSILSTIPGDTYDFLSGTSMASPNAAGAAALIWSANPTWTNYQVAAQLVGTADNIDAQNPGFEGLLGGGRVNSFNALVGTPNAPSITGLIGAPADGAVTEDTTINSIQVDFDGVLDPATAMNPANYELRNAGLDGVFDTVDDEVLTTTITNLYMFGSNQVDLKITGSLEIGEYRLSVLSGGIVDPFGTLLDGDGDGVAGGNFETFFSVVNPFKKVGPEPSLIAKRTDSQATLSGAGDSDLVRFFAENEETVSAVATPTDGSVTLTLELSGVIGPISAAAPGESVVLPVTAILADGDFDLLVSADGATTYSLAIYRNADIQGLNETPGDIALDDTGIGIQLGSTRYAAVASANGVTGEPTFEQYNDASRFVDISGTGTGLGLGDDSEATIITTIGNSLIPAGVITIGNNGVVAAGAGVNVDFENDLIPSSDFGSALFPFWDDIDSESGDVYWQETVVGGIDTLIVQWDDRPHFSNVGSSTFQVQLFESGPVLARFAYADIDFGDARYDFGASASIGFQAGGTLGTEFSIDAATLANNDVLDITLGTPATDVDTFTIDFADSVGESIDLYFESSSPHAGSTVVELLDPSNNVVATGITGTSFDVAIQDAEVASAGTYTIRVSASFPGEYLLVVTEGLAIDNEPNDSIGSARDVSAYDGVFGEMSAGSVRFSTFNSIDDFIDIATTGTPLNLTDDGEATITTTVGNSAFPAGTVTVGNNGVVTAGAGVDVATGNGSLPSENFGAALVVFWDDIDADSGNVYWQETVVDGINTLIVQWDSRPHFSNIGEATFQMQLFETGPLVARYAYKDVDFGDSDFDFGASATVGFQFDSTDGATFLQDQAMLSNGDVVDILTVEEDIFLLDLTVGEEATFSTSTPFDEPDSDVANTLDVDLVLLNGSGDPVAMDSDSAGDGRNAQFSYTPTTSGPHYIKVLHIDGAGEYVLSFLDGDSPSGCDIDGDGGCDTSDLRVLYDDIAIDAAGGPSDIDGDGFVTNDDIDDWLLLAGTENGKVYKEGDTNLDGNVSGSDFTDLAFNFGNIGTPDGAYWDQGNFDGKNLDGQFDVGGPDFTALAVNFGHTSVAPARSLTPPMSTFNAERSVAFVGPIEVTQDVDRADGRQAEVFVPTVWVAKRETADDRLRIQRTHTVDQVFAGLDEGKAPRVNKLPD